METIYFTPSHVMEHLFCPRFTYFMNVLKVPQHEENREKVRIGRSVHEKRSKQNTEYLRKRLQVKEKIIEPYLVSARYHIKGKVDEILITETGEYIVLDYKFAEYKDILFSTYRTQLCMYGLCINDMFSTKMLRGFLVFTRSKNKLLEINTEADDYKFVVKILNEMLLIIQTEFFPKVRKHGNKCIDCTYRKLCV